MSTLKGRWRIFLKGRWRIFFNTARLAEPNDRSSLRSHQTRRETPPPKLIVYFKKLFLQIARTIVVLLILR
ncbi:MAG: hypothetical protein ACI9R3_004195, partial [Verrucomicrobiales bacterium]